MYKILITTLCLIVGLNICKAQNTVIPQTGDNIIDNNINKFVGTWKWRSDNKELTLYIKKENIQISTGSYFKMDALVGFHKLIINNNVIENSIQFNNTKHSDKKSTLIGRTSSVNTPNNAKVVIVHNNKNIEGTLTYISNNQIKISNIKNAPGIKINKNYNAEILFPIEMNFYRE